MFPSKVPLLPLIVACLIVLVIIIGMFLTNNPLMMMGLYFLPQVPVFGPGQEEEQEEEEGNYAGNQIGFHTGESQEDQ